MTGATVPSASSGTTSRAKASVAAVFSSTLRAAEHGAVDPETLAHQRADLEVGAASGL